MSSRTQRQLVEEALALPAKQKAKLAEKLLESLDSAEQTEIDAAWAEEVERRIDELDAGRAKTIPAEEVFRRLRGRKK